MARRRRKGSGGWALVLLVALAVPAVIWGPELFRDHSYRLTTERCMVTHGTVVDNKTAEQVNNAAIISAVGLSYGFDEYGVTVALATAIQESSLRNLSWGDSDSLGLFQQRPSQGWGTEEEIQDPHYSASKFYQALERVDGWRDMPLTVAAQEVQRSGFPDAYADHETEGAAWSAALTGGDALIDCRVSGVTTTPQAFLERLNHDFGSGRYAVEVVDGTSSTMTLSVVPIVADATDIESAVRAAKSFHQWSIATAVSTGVVGSVRDEVSWVNGKGVSVDDGWARPEDYSPVVVVTIATAAQ